MKPLTPDVFVNGEKIASATIAAEAQNHKAPAGKPGLAWRAAARALVVRKLLLQEVAKAGLNSNPARLGPDKAESEEEAVIRVYLDANLKPKSVTEAEVDAVVEKFKDNPEATKSGAREHLEQIAWTLAASSLVTDLVDKAEITGVDMAVTTG
jgi:peptidyl-prolyl cis-trans isomerase C